MFYLLVHFTGVGETSKEFFEFNTEKGLLEFVTDNFKTEGFKVHKILKEVVEYEVNYALSLKPAKKRRVSAASALARAEGQKPQEPEKEPEPERDLGEKPERKCSSCGDPIKAWSKTGKCTSCQQGKKSSKK